MIHSANDGFNIDLTRARVGDSANPFLDAAAVPSGTTAGAVSPAAESEAGMEGGIRMQRRRRMIIAHGVLMSLAFVIFYPMGAIIIRLLSFKGLVWVHAGTQVFAYTLALAGMGIGVWFTQNSDQSVSRPSPSCWQRLG